MSFVDPGQRSHISCLSTYSTGFSSETTVQPPSKGGKKVYKFRPGHMTKMAARPIYNKNLKKSPPPHHKSPSGEPGLVDRVLALHAGSRGFDSHGGHRSEQFFRSNRPGYPHPVSSELENSRIRVAVGDCSVTERRRWRPPYQTDKTVLVHAKHYKHNEDGRTAPCVCGNVSVPLSHLGNVVTRIGIHTHFFP